MNTTAINILKEGQENDFKRVFIHEPFTLDNPKDAEKFGFIYGGTNENGTQHYINTSVAARMSPSILRVYELLLDGKRLDAITQEMNISEKTVFFYCNRVRELVFNKKSIIINAEDVAELIGELKQN